MDEVKRPLIALIAIVVIVTSLISIYFTQRKPSQRANLKPFEAVGEVAAEETIKLLNGRGRVVVLVYGGKMPSMMVPLEQFKKTIEPHPGLSIAATETVVINPMEASGPEMMGVPGSKFLDMLAKHPGVDAVVSFVGVPYLQPADFERYPNPAPKVIAVATFGLQIKQLLQQNIVHVAIVPRYKSPTETTKEPVTRREWFDKFYTVVTAENASDLPN